MPDQNAMPDQTAPGTARPAATRAGLAGPLSAVLFTAAGVAGFVLETTARSAGFDDGDNPAQSVALFAVNPTPYSLSGLTLAIAALALLMLVLAVHESVLAAVRPLYARFVTGIGLISAVLLFLGGVIRLQAPGTVTHIAGLDREWGLAAYLAVQMSGTQGALSAAIFAFALWAVGLCVTASRPHTLPLPVLLVGLLPALVLAIPLTALAGRVIGQDTSDVLYPIYLIGIFVGIPLFTLAVGWVLWRRRRAT